MRHRFVACTLVAGVFGSLAHADIIDFEDLAPSTIGTPMVAGYAGLNWGSGWHHMTSIGGNNFLALSIPSTFVVSSDGTDFVFEGAEFWSRRGADPIGDFYFVLYHDGVTVYNGLIEDDGRQRFDATPRFFATNYTGLIDGFAIAFDNDDHDHLAMDNLRASGIPTPGGLAMVMALGGVGLRRRR